LSKLNALRAGKPAAPAIFSNSVSSSVADVFKRVQEGKPSRTFEKKKWKPSRFRVAKGETKRLVVLDSEISYAQAEHTVKDREGKWQTERCISSVDACPICSLPKHNPADVVLLTVLDLTPWNYEDKDGNTIEKEYTKRELAIKTGSFPIFQALAAAQGGLRGLVLDMTRGHGDKEAAIGVPAYVQTLTEEELIEAFGGPEKLSEEGRVIVEENADTKPFNYEKVHEIPSRSELASKYGIAPRPGSQEELAQEEAREQTQEETVALIDLSEELPNIE
jgi:hypothetical protein